MTQHEARSTGDGDPPILGRWPRLYAAVLAALVLEVMLFYAFTRFFQ